MNQLAVSHVHGDEEIGNEEKGPHSFLHSVEQSVNPGGEILYCKMAPNSFFQTNPCSYVHTFTSNKKNHPRSPN